MARKIHSRLKIKGELIAQSALHVGGLGESVETDLAFAENGSGNHYVPGTSLAGVFRAWCRTAFEDAKFLLRVWGNQDTRKIPDAQKEYEGASYVFVENAVICGGEIEIADGVGIDRRWGTAADQAKFDRAILPAGTKIPLEMTVELPADNKDSENPKDHNREHLRRKTKAVIGHLLEALEKGSVRLGAAGTRGLGRIRLENLNICEQDLSSLNGILDAVLGKGKTRKPADLQNEDSNLKPTAPPRLKVTMDWTPELPTMTKSALEGIEIDMLPLLRKKNAESHCPVIPGGGIKGVLRSHAERIVRTLAARDADTDFLEQVDVPLIRWLFGLGGSPEEKKDDKRKDAEKKKRKDESDETTGIGRSALDALDCFAQPVPMGAWWDLLSKSAEGDQPVVAPALNGMGKKNWTHAQHVAIDRWEGGASEGALFNALELRGETWESIVLEVDFSRLPEAMRLPALALLLLTLEDFADGEVPLGFGGNRGMGSVRVSTIHFDLAEGKSVPENAEKLSGSYEPPFIPKLNGALKNTLKDAWRKWVDELPHAWEEE